MRPISKAALIVGAIILSLVPAARSDNVESFENARSISAATGKPILIEFYRTDCEYCELAAREAKSDSTVEAALTRVVHLPLNVLEGEGIDLAETYRAGIYFPAFILTDSGGSVIARWAGYANAGQFIYNFNEALSDLSTVEERVARADVGPTAANVQFLAKYFSEAQQYLKSRDYYRRLQAMQGSGIDLSYQIFAVTAEAVWNDLLPFDSLLPAADSVLYSRRRSSRNLERTARIVADLASKTGTTASIRDYLLAGIKATSTRKDQPGIDLHRDLLSDYALHVLKDTLEAISVKQKALGDGWENDPARCFKFGEWSFKRGINIARAEAYVRKATDLATEDKFKATHLRLLAEIVFALGRNDEAIALAEQALALDPTTAYFEKKLAAMRAAGNR